MYQVKGVLFMFLVKTIRANKSGVYNDILTERDWDFISQKILSSVWYPFDVYENCFNAIAKVEANGSMNMIKRAGRNHSEEIMTSVYKIAIFKGNPKKSIKAFVRLFKLMFNFGIMECDQVSDNQVIISYIDFTPNFEVFYYAASGWTEKFIELVIGEGKKVKSEFLERSWKGGSKTSIKYVWES
jgi:hypothetical protein